MRRTNVKTATRLCLKHHVEAVLKEPDAGKAMACVDKVPDATNQANETEASTVHLHAASVPTHCCKDCRHLCCHVQCQNCCDRYLPQQNVEVISLAQEDTGQQQKPGQHFDKVAGRG